MHRILFHLFNLFSLAELSQDYLTFFDILSSASVNTDAENYFVSVCSCLQNIMPYDLIIRIITLWSELTASTPWSNGLGFGMKMSMCYSFMRILQWPFERLH